MQPNTAKDLSNQFTRSNVCWNESVRVWWRNMPRKRANNIYDNINVDDVKAKQKMTMFRFFKSIALPMHFFK